jgi:hypothetical protein
MLKYNTMLDVEGFPLFWQTLQLSPLGLMSWGVGHQKSICRSCSEEREKDEGTIG